MKKWIKEFFFDRELVEQIKRNNPSVEHLHNLLLEGKINLQEYFKVVSCFKKDNMQRA